MSFDTLSLSASIIKAISKKGYNTPTPIQAQTIPLILQGKDIMGRAQTGTGKTAGYTLPLLEIVSEQAEKDHKRFIRALILVPTRELAIQVEQSVRVYGKYLPLTSTAVYGGVRISSQILKLRKGVDILIATPGRLLDLVNQKKVNLSQVSMFVLDEADRLLDMGFVNDIRTVISLLPPKRQSLLFSATFTKRVNQLAESFLNNPVKVEVAAENATADHIEQTIHLVDRSQKTQLLCHLIQEKDLQQVLIFTRTKRGADQLADRLNDEGIIADSFHGDMNQRVRIKALKKFKEGRTKALVATDVASRGIDIDHLSHVINFELPCFAEDYIHRIGRTGRAGRKGNAISLVSSDEYKFFREIKNLIKCDLATSTVAGFEPKQKKEQKPDRKKRPFGFSFKQKSKSGFDPKNRKRKGSFRGHEKRKSRSF